MVPTANALIDLRLSMKKGFILKRSEMKVKS
jgi:hypothetical protein